MDVIFTIILQICLWQQYVPISHNIMVYHIGNVHYAVARNDLVLVYLVRIQINMQQTRVQKYILMFTGIYHVVLFMVYTHMKN